MAVPRIARGPLLSRLRSRGGQRAPRRGRQRQVGRARIDPAQAARGRGRQAARTTAGTIRIVQRMMPWRTGAAGAPARRCRPKSRSTVRSSAVASRRTAAASAGRARHRAARPREAAPRRPAARGNPRWPPRRVARRTSTRPFRRTSAATRSIGTAAGRLARSGNRSGVRLPAQRTGSRSGQTRHCGAAGRHSVAPSSISAWLKSPGRARSSSASACARSAARPAALRGSSGSGEQSRQHALDVAVDGRDRLAVRDRGHGRGGVVADTGQRAQTFRAARQLAAGCARPPWPRRAGAARGWLVAEPGPGREQLVLAGARQIRGLRPAREEALQ